MLDSRFFIREFCEPADMRGGVRESFDTDRRDRMNPVSDDGKVRTTYTLIPTNGVFNYPGPVTVGPSLPDLILLPALEEDYALTLNMLGDGNA